VIEFIRSARRSLLLSVFRCDDLPVLHELAEAAARGVHVEVLVTERARGWGKRLGPLAGCLARMGAAVYRFQRAGMKYHAKYMVADEERALVGTLNLTRKCFRRTRDFLLVTQDAAIAQSLVRLFRADAAGHPLADTIWTSRLILGPGSSRQGIEALLSDARRSIRILDHKLSDPGILALLRDCKRKGISVEVESGALDSELSPHGRLIVIDGRIAVFGSFSLTSRSLDSRRELAILVEEPPLVAKLDRQFDRIKSVKSVAAEAAA
jgi:phosphatidylserine/phosphatidylglycerophosphate/cardiolipin synthase-like enzyme